MLASYQRQLGGALGVLPGSELLAAARAAGARGIPVRLCDRDVRVTLRRAWAALSLWRKAQLIAGLLQTLFETPQLGEDDLRELRRQDVLSRLMRELGEAFPALKTVLIDERDAYLAEQLRRAPGARIVAVVGAGHVAGMRAALEADARADLAALETRPADLAGGAAGRLEHPGGDRPVAAASSACAKARRRPATTSCSGSSPPACPASSARCSRSPIRSPCWRRFCAAPFTALSPFIGVGYVAAFVQAYVRPPLVREIQTVTDDVRIPRRWWQNRLLRICLVFLLTTIGTSMGTLVGTAEILRRLF